MKSLLPLHHASGTPDEDSNIDPGKCSVFYINAVKPQIRLLKRSTSL